QLDDIAGELREARSRAQQSKKADAQGSRKTSHRRRSPLFSRQFTAIRVDGKNVLDSQKHPYAVLNYATGPGGHSHEDDPELSPEALNAPNARHPALVPMGSAAHSGEDVPVYATGPQAHLLTGVMEASYIYQVMAHALGIDTQK
ncbi:MAG: hypothetical protein B7Z26_00425, partial [Asticcacaulis sp. 32-58-5]